MTSTSLVRRRRQLDVLADACHWQQRARVSVRTPVRGCLNGATRLLALDGDALLISWPGDEFSSFLREGAPVEVFFGHEGERYAFSAHVRGRDDCPGSGDGAARALRLTVPLRVEQREQRDEFRLALPEAEPVEARFSGTVKKHVRFDARLTNLSSHGLGSFAPGSLAPDLEPGDAFWVEFQLPGEPRRFEFVARLVHQHADARRQGVILGWRFCAVDNPAEHFESLKHLARFVVERQHISGETVPRNDAQEAEGCS